ncbi:efflux RND transporter periplasmic adaptor subunit [Pseudaminobacter soli (ex Li et al. 2025)]|uniref:Efflux RND transporter periplasmic adaptor subunit n=1 Tax=Pseudaminobacter soli (ex Li et al. 2025) TaxID=1295366 RepID=A0A2P7S1F6_9HYPH|nr:efflux RND transporter periplasmic adaptor subunit [Mesorhizobium soli]PSJ56281.1 efflux RND transporter periplasmic adaptor subunit [Mesorhizobium soli]
MISCSLAHTHHFAPAALMAVIALGVAGCQRQTSQPQSFPTVVQVGTVTMTDYAPAVRLTGEIRAQVESDLSFRVAGRISDRLVDVGDHVTADQVLARLDPQQQQATLTAANADVQAADAVLRQNTSAYKRQKALLARGFTTQRQHDQAQEAFRTAQASLDAAKAQLGTARDHLSDTVVRAGVSGVITARQAEVGQVVEGAQTIFSIARDGPRDAVFNVYESILTHVPANPAIELTLVSDPAVKARGTLREISPTVDPSSGTVRVKVGIEHPPAAMTLGAAVVGEGRLQPRKLVLVPWSALTSKNGHPAVWTVDPQTRTVSLKPISIEGYDMGKVVVREGLRPGELVVTGGAQFLRPQQAVAIAEGAAL